MAVPKKRTSSSRRKKRRSHHFLRPINVILCKKCASPKLPHHICGTCGFYRNKKVIGGERDE
jgi:large subunit ribosomal protein L32